MSEKGQALQQSTEQILLRRIDQLEMRVQQLELWKVFYESSPHPKRF